MNIGALNQKITIQAPTTVRSSTTGEASQTWAALCEVWATVSYPKAEFSANEGNELGRETTITPVNFTIWHRTDLGENMRVLFGGQYFDIMRINQAGQMNEMLKLVTQKKV